MVKLYVDHEKLVDLSVYLSDKSIEISDLIEKMASTVESMKTAWDGLDSQVFIAKAEVYIDNLRRIQSGIYDCSSKMIGKETRYANAFVDYFSRDEKEKENQA